jgi:hypothetical protein
MYSLPHVVMSSVSCARGEKEREGTGLVLANRRLAGACVWVLYSDGCRSSWKRHVSSIHVRICGM